MPRQSRGCDACRRRRIGCDGGTPSCRICLINHRICSGPVTGVVIVDQTSSVTTRQRRARALAQLNRSNRSSSQVQRPIATVDPGLIAAFLQFIGPKAVNRKEEGSWALKAYVDTWSDTSSAYQVAIEAAALAFHSVHQQGGHEVGERARSVYVRALQRHATAVSVEDPGSAFVGIGTSIMLSVFESLLPTNTVAYGIHLRAARCLLAENFLTSGHGHGHDEWLQQVHRHVQYQTLFTMIANPQEHLRIAPKTPCRATLQTSLGHSPLEPVDRLLPVLFQLVEHLLQRAHGANSTVDSVACLERLSNDIWAEYEAASTSGPLPLNDSSSTTFVYFASTRILIQAMGKRPLSVTTLSDLEDQCSLVLLCDQLTRSNDSASAQLQMLFPLRLVAMFSPSSEQRSLAQRFEDGTLNSSENGTFDRFDNKTLDERE